MAELGDFHANGVTFPDQSRADIDKIVSRIPDAGTLHLAILRQPYLDLIVDGTKTLESRFNTKRAAPFGRVAVGDLILLKGSGRPITNYFFASAARSIWPLSRLKKSAGCMATVSAPKTKKNFGRKGHNPDIARSSKSVSAGQSRICMW